MAAAMVAACHIADTVPPAALPDPSAPFVFVLGTAQDGGYPQAGCDETHCAPAWSDARLRRNVASIAVVDPVSRQRWIIDATPDFPEQLRILDEVAPADKRGRRDPGISGILLTHAHIGHYAGLIHLGREVLSTASIRVYAMPRMAEFLRNNGPWSQLVQLGNIRIEEIGEGEFELNERISVRAFPVPHRDELSETVGFIVRGPSRSVLFIPDIDKWERWDRSIEDFIRGVDFALLDGTFYADGEIPGRSMSEIPHPFIVESMGRFAALPMSERRKIRFIHLNHTNPALQLRGEARRNIEGAGYGVAEQYERLPL